MSKKRKKRKDSIPTFDEYLAENFPSLDFSDDFLQSGLEDPEYYYDEIQLKPVEVGVLMSFTLDELKRLEQAISKSSELEDLYLAMMLRDAIKGSPF